MITLEKRKWDSSLLTETEYDSDTQELTIEFNNGQRYLYKNFSIEDYDTFCAAESKGKHFLTEIRKRYKNSEDMIKLETDEQSTRS